MGTVELVSTNCLSHGDCEGVSYMGIPKTHNLGAVLAYQCLFMLCLQRLGDLSHFKI